MLHVLVVVVCVVILQQGKMREMLEELRMNLGMPLDQSVDGEDYGYRSTTSMKNLESRYDQDMMNEASVPVQRAVTPPRSATRRSPPRPSSGVGRPPVARLGRGRSDSAGTDRQDSVEVRDTSPLRINVLTIDSQFENTNHSNYTQPMENTFVESDDGYDEVDGSIPQGQLTQTYTRSLESAGDQAGSSSSARRRRRSRPGKNSLEAALSTEQHYADPSPWSPDVDETPDGMNVDNPPSPDDQNRLALDRTQTVEATGGLENRDVRYSGSEPYRQTEHDDVDEVVNKQNVDDDEEEDDSYGAYETNDQMVDTIVEYQQKLEKTNFVDEAGNDSAEDAVTERSRAPVPLPRRQATADNPRSASPPRPESPADSLDVSELEEDEYLEC